MSGGRGIGAATRGGFSRGRGSGPSKVTAAPPPSSAIHNVFMALSERVDDIGDYSLAARQPDGNDDGENGGGRGGRFVSQNIGEDRHIFATKATSHHGHNSSGGGGGGGRHKEFVLSTVRDSRGNIITSNAQEAAQCVTRRELESRSEEDAMMELGSAKTVVIAGRVATSQMMGKVDAAAFQNATLAEAKASAAKRVGQAQRVHDQVCMMLNDLCRPASTAATTQQNQAQLPLQPVDRRRARQDKNDESSASAAETTSSSSSSVAPPNSAAAEGKKKKKSSLLDNMFDD